MANLIVVSGPQAVEYYVEQELGECKNSLFS